MQIFRVLVFLSHPVVSIYTYTIQLKNTKYFYRDNHTCLQSSILQIFPYLWHLEQRKGPITSDLSVHVSRFSVSQSVTHLFQNCLISFRFSLYKVKGGGVAEPTKSDKRVQGSIFSIFCPTLMYIKVIIVNSRLCFDV